jgi:hypothetical protein
MVKGALGCGARAGGNDVSFVFTWVGLGLGLGQPAKL